MKTIFSMVGVVFIIWSLSFCKFAWAESKNLADPAILDPWSQLPIAPQPLVATKPAVVLGADEKEDSKTRPVLAGAPGVPSSPQLPSTPTQNPAAPATVTQVPAPVKTSAAAIQPIATASNTPVSAPVSANAPLATQPTPTQPVGTNPVNPTTLSNPPNAAIPATATNPTNPQNPPNPTNPNPVPSTVASNPPPSPAQPPASEFSYGMQALPQAPEGPPVVPPVSELMPVDALPARATSEAGQPNGANFGNAAGILPPASEVAIILAQDRFFPPRVRLREGQPTRIIFTTINKQPAALIIEKLRVQKWVGKDRLPFNANELERSKWEVNREVTQNKITEVQWEPKRGTYSFHDAISGAEGEIEVE